MSSPTYPLKLVPLYLPKPWGGRRMDTALGRELPAGEPIGESWELYDREKEGSSEIGNGPLRGRRVAELRGNRPIPILTKVIDASQTLSVQVHPDEKMAVALRSEAKTEAWYILEVEPGAKIYKGLKAGVDRETLRRGIEAGTVADLLHSFTPRPGDLVFLPAGTVHAIGAGILLYEVQQNSDTTYRLFDWNRPGLNGKLRDLHVEEGVSSADCTGPGLPRVEPREIADDGRYRRTIRCSCPEFMIEEQEILGLATFETEREREDRWHLVFILHGEGTIRPLRRGTEETLFAAGDSLLLPAEHHAYEIEPHPGRTVRLLTTSVPGTEMVGR